MAALTPPAAADMSYTAAKGEQEHILPLPNNRQLAYAHNGPPTSRTVILFFTGLLSVGSCPGIPLPCRELSAHWIAPTLPGMGNSSSRAPDMPYHVSLARDIGALLAHLYPPGANDFHTLYLAGGSYGTVPAQMLYGAAYELFPHGRKLVACLLLSGFSPLKHHAGYGKTLNWPNYFSFGPPARWVPFHVLQWLFRWVVGSKMGDLEGAKTFLRRTLFERMDGDEKGVFRGWLEGNALGEEAFVEGLADGAMRCCRNWDGFMEVADVMESDWGFEPRKLDEEHASKGVLVVGSENDQMGGGANGWLVENYRSARLKVVPGGHISSMFYMDEIWKEVIGMVK